ncbi:MAG: hypothetical protein ACFFDU_00010 [Candidatus Thorarchaeota archaeon]
MPSKRSSSIIGIWVVVAILVIVDAFLFSGLLLDSLVPGLSGITNVMIFALIPFIAASLLLDRRTSPLPSNGPSRQPPQGTLSASGEQLGPTRPKPRIRRDKRAAQLETIVVEPGVSGNGSVTSNSSLLSSSDTQPASTSAKFLRARRSRSEEAEEMDQQVKEQLDAIELEMAKLEEQLEQNGVTPPSSNSESDSVNDEPVQTTPAAPSNPGNSTISSEEATSELQAIDELLTRLDQRKRAGGVEEETYQRLREKYLKRRSELA